MVEITNSLRHCKLHLKDPYPKLQLARNKDMFLMKWFFDQGYRDTDLLKLNHCRQYLSAGIFNFS